MMRPGLFALAVLLFGCQRSHTSTDEESGGAAKARAAQQLAAGNQEQAPVAAPTLAKPPAPTTNSPESPPPLGGSDWKATPMGRDLERICNVLAYAGVVGKTANEQLDAIVEWLPRNIESEQGREFLGSIADLSWAAKADTLEGAAQKVGVVGCPLAVEWRKI